MSEMIERVARAIDVLMEDGGPVTSEAIARAAIEAMKNPSIEMRSAAQQAFIRNEQNQLTAMWNAMIDEALLR